jgi:hypothetical protein
MLLRRLANEAILPAGIPFERQSALGPSLPLSTEAMWWLHQRNQRGVFYLRLITFGVFPDAISRQTADWQKNRALASFAGGISENNVATFLNCLHGADGKDQTRTSIGGFRVSNYTGGLHRLILESLELFEIGRLHFDRGQALPMEVSRRG